MGSAKVWLFAIDDCSGISTALSTRIIRVVVRNLLPQES
jgi:hypothetical protein